MQLDRESLIAIAQELDKNDDLGLVKAAKEDSTPLDAKDRNLAIEIFQAAYQTSAIILALRLVIAETNKILAGLDPKAESPEILRTVEANLIAAYLEPAKKNKAKIQAIIHAVIKYIHTKLK